MASPRSRSKARRAGCRLSPCSAWCTTSRCPSRLMSATSTVCSCRYSSVVGAPMRPTRTEKPVRSAVPSASRPSAARASPALQAGSTSGASGATSPPWKGWSRHTPISSPLESSNHSTPWPSGVGAPMTTPVGWSVTCRWLPSRRSQAWTCQEPERLEAYTSRSGSPTAQCGKVSDGARKRRFQRGSVISVMGRSSQPDRGVRAGAGWAVSGPPAPAGRLPEGPRGASLGVPSGNAGIGVRGSGLLGHGATQHTGLDLGPGPAPASGRSDEQEASMQRDRDPLNGEGDRLLHMIGNSHIDPVWLWRWPEGYQAVRATFWSVIERMREYPELRFTCDSVVQLAWVEESDPELFEEIRHRVAEGRWEIVGGWWVEPDCNLPCGESFARQGLYGQRWLRERFGRIATVGCNVDPFGHNATLPQILRSSGMDTYLFLRPGPHELRLPGPAFWWRSPDGSRVLAYRIPHEYQTVETGLDEHVRAAVAQFPPDWRELACLYGVGNHGGGPSRANLDSIRRMSEAEEPARLECSTARRFFDRLLERGEDLPVVAGELQHHAVGCYSAHAGVKRWNRRAENLLLAAEKWTAVAAVVAGTPPATAELSHAWRQVLFNQFHDVLAGTSIEEAYEDARDQLGEAAAIAGRAGNRAVQAISRRIGIEPVPGTTPVVVFNPHPWPVRADLEVEVEAGPSGPPARMADERGRPVPVQTIQPSATVPGWRHRLVFPAELPPLGYRTYRLYGDRAGGALPAAGPCGSGVRLAGEPGRAGQRRGAAGGGDGAARGGAGGHHRHVEPRGTGIRRRGRRLHLRVAARRGGRAGAGGRAGRLAVPRLDPDRGPGARRGRDPGGARYARLARAARPAEAAGGHRAPGRGGHLRYPLRAPGAPAGRRRGAGGRLGRRERQAPRRAARRSGGAQRRQARRRRAGRPHRDDGRAQPRHRLARAPCARPWRGLPVPGPRGAALHLPAGPARRRLARRRRGPGGGRAEPASGRPGRVVPPGPVRTAALVRGGRAGVGAAVGPQAR